MATVTGDIQINFAPLPDETGWTDPDYTQFGTRLDIVSGSLRSGSGISYFRTVSVPTENILKAKIELSGEPTGDPCGPAFINASGNGYWLRSNYNEFHINTLISGVPTRIGANILQTVTANDEIEIWLDLGTNTITTYHNGVELESLVDTTYTTDLHSGYVSSRENTASAGAVSFAGEGYSVVATATLDAPLVYGAAFSGTYSNYTGVPTGPATITDSQSNVLSVAVTVTDNGDGTGTFSGTFPSLPIAGADAPALLTGDITLNLPDPGV